MYMHIGEDTLVRTREIIAILDKESASHSAVLKEFLSQHKAETTNLSKNEYKSIVITKDQVYYSPLAAGTLKKRSHKPMVQEHL